MKALLRDSWIVFTPRPEVADGATGETLRVHARVRLFRDVARVDASGNYLVTISRDCTIDEWVGNANGAAIPTRRLQGTFVRAAAFDKPEHAARRFAQWSAAPRLEEELHWFGERGEFTEVQP